MKVFECQKCGGRLSQIGEGLYRCECCGKDFREDHLERELSALSLLLSAEKQEQVGHLRQLLWEESHKAYIDRDALRNAAHDLRKLLPDDKRAAFYEAACSDNHKEMIKFLKNLDVSACEDDMEEMVAFLIKSLRPQWISHVANLIESAFNHKDKLHLYAGWCTRFEMEAEKINQGIYDVTLPRDVFLAYSSADKDIVFEVADYLEELGVSCFVALRNLQHGVGAVQNYESSLKKAIDACEIFVLVSSSHSRSNQCDAFTKEMAYLRDKEMHDAPPQYHKHSYDSLPDKYKKKRIEYVIDQYRNTPFDMVTKQFFAGLTWCRSLPELATRVLLLRNSALIEDDEKPKTSENTDSRDSASILKRAYIYIEDGHWAGAKDSCERALDADPTNAEAYLCKLMIQFKCKTKEELANQPKPFDDLYEYKKAMQYGSDELKAFLQSCTDTILARIEQERIEREKRAEQERIAREKKAQQERIEREKKAEQERIEREKKAEQERIAREKQAEQERIAREKQAAKIKKVIGISAMVVGALVTALLLVVFLIVPAIQKHNGSYGFRYKIENDQCEITRYVGKDSDVTIPLAIKGTPVTSIGGGAFSGCTNLTSVTIPDSVTSIGNGAFSYCSSLTSVVIPDSVTNIGDQAFKNCSTLSSVTIGDGVTSIGSSAFAYCYSLTSVVIPDSVTGIGSSAFAYCSSLTSVVIPNSVTSIGEYAFVSCSSLASVTIGNSVTSIGEGAFSNCSSLTSVTIPNSVTSIGEYAFVSCSSLASVTFENTKGWKAGYTSISSTDLADNTIAAQYLRSTYRSYSWTRS